MHWCYYHRGADNLLSLGGEWCTRRTLHWNFTLKKANAESISSALVEYCREKNIQLGRLIGMGFDGAATFSGDKIGVQRRLKVHALFVHCHCQVLQLASVQAANAIPGIKHVYSTLMPLWMFFHCSPKHAESLKKIQKVLDLPELKIVKPSDTHWLACERCVKAVKASYSSIILALEKWNIAWTRSSWTK